MAFTLTELLVSIGIIAILATLTVQGYSKIAASVAKGKCIANLRNLHVAFATYIQDNGYWPQQPDFESAYSQQYQDWWLNDDGSLHEIPRSLEVSASEEIRRLRLRGQKSWKFTTRRRGLMRGPRRLIAGQKQPWLIEVSSIHGNGPLLLMPDGSVRNLTDLVPNFYKTKN